MSRPFLTTLGVLLAVRAIFVVTYPLNDLGGDTSVYYYEMMLARRSNLTLAPGYPFLVGLVPRLVGLLWSASGPQLATVVLVAQHALDLVVCASMFAFVRRIHGVWTAGLCVLVYGLSPSATSVTSAAYPEWLQGDLLALTFVAAFVAIHSPNARRHALGYVAAVLAATWCTITKFNAAPAVLLVLLAMFLADPARPARKARALALATLAAASTAGLFVWSHHYPSTGTLALSRDRSWILVQRIAALGNDALTRYRTGPASLRWLALATILPPRYDLSHAYGNLREAGSRPLRAPYRSEYRRIMAMDEPALRAWLSRTQLPSGFELAQSSIPVAVFVGLAESDDLGVAVYREFVLDNPGAFAKSVARDSWRSLRLGHFPPLVPLGNSLAAFHVAPGAWQAGGFRRYTALPSAPPDYRCTYVHGDAPANPEPGGFSYSLWEPGVRLLTVLDDAERVLRPPLWAPLLVVGAVALVRMRRDRGPTQETAVAAGLCLLVLGFVVFSNTIHFYRWKEARFIAWPCAWLIALSLTWALPQLLAWLSRRIGLPFSSRR